MAEAIKNFDEEKAILISRIITRDLTINQGANLNYQCTFNPIDKPFQAIEEYKTLYERLLQPWREKVEILQKAAESR